MSWSCATVFSQEVETQFDLATSPVLIKVGNMFIYFGYLPLGLDVTHKTCSLWRLLDKR